MTNAEMLRRIRAIAYRSKRFKIGKTGQYVADRLLQHDTKYDHIEPITYSSSKYTINNAEEDMLEYCLGMGNCDNKKGGSAGRMVNSPEYVLYVIYTLK